MLDLGALRARINDTQQQLTDAEARRDDLQAQVESLDFSLNVLAGQADELSADLDSRRRDLGARLADAWRATTPSLWEQVVSAGSFIGGIVQQQGYLTLGAQDLQLAQSIQRDQTLLDQQRLGLQHLSYDTQQLHTEVAASAVQITLERNQLLASQVTLAALESQTAALQAKQAAQYAKVLENQARAAAILAKQQAADALLGKHINALLEKERHSGSLPSKFNGTLRWPIIAPISQDFGCTGFILEPPYEGCAHFHRGIDIVGPAGSHIVAAGDGVVLYVGWDPGVPRKDAAYIVIIAHSSRMISIYAHLQPVAPHKMVKGRRVETIVEGAKVKAGQVIGFEGNTGNSTGAHLHWGVMFDGEYVNPRLFL
jgi:murein DD-endopeptidase MepM/ murein hydrolase activator NlpD